MVDDRVQGEVDPLHLHWFFDQALLKVMPEGSAREPIGGDAKIEARIKQARLEVERSYRSTLDVLSGGLNNAKEEIPQRDVIFEVRVRKHHSTILA